MRNRGMIMLALAIVLGLCSTVLVRQWMGRFAAPVAAPSLPVRPVVVARAALNFGDKVTATSLRVIEWPAELAPEGSFSKIEDLTGNGEDRVVLRAIEPGEAVLASKVSGQGGRAVLSTIIDRDMRAMTIKVNEVYGVAGFVRPNDRVDVLLTRKPQHGEPTTDILLQNVKVLGVDQEASDKRDKPSVARAVTVEVSAEQAQKITLAAQVGTLSLSLRNQANANAAPARTIGLRDLRIGEVAAPAQAAPSRPMVDPLAKIEVLRGTESKTHEVPREPPSMPRVRGKRDARAGFGGGIDG
jgi:pilus assembly protein CpaB